MSSQRVLGRPANEAPRQEASVVPLFVCPGVRDTPIEHALFPYGSGFSEPQPCPGRDVCLWYAAHDLGGEVEFNDFPGEAQLSPLFLATPFSCPNFNAHRENSRRNRSRSLPSPAQREFAALAAQV